MTDCLSVPVACCWWCCCIELHEVLVVWTSALAGKKFLHGDSVSIHAHTVTYLPAYPPTHLLTYTSTHLHIYPPTHLHPYTGEHARPVGVRRAALHPGVAHLRGGDDPQPAAERVVRRSRGVGTVQSSLQLTYLLKLSLD